MSRAQAPAGSAQAPDLPVFRKTEPSLPQCADKFSDPGLPGKGSVPGVPAEPPSPDGQ